MNDAIPIVVVLVAFYNLLGAALTLSMGDTRIITNGHRRFAARVAYDGTDFNGFQIQPQLPSLHGKRTVQGECERALAVILQQPTRISAASRTDTGVHARGQTIHFDAPSAWASRTGALNCKLNSILPKDVRVRDLSPAPCHGTVDGLPWHATYATTGKLYSYRWRCAPYMDPLDRRDRALWFRNAMDVDAIRACLPSFEGSRDFASFGNSLELDVNTVRTIKNIELIKECSLRHDYRLDVELDGALYKMVRNIVGMLFGVGCGQFTPEDIGRFLGARNRSMNHARAAPAAGLTLEHVYYDDF